MNICKRAADAIMSCTATFGLCNQCEPSTGKAMDPSMKVMYTAANLASYIPCVSAPWGGFHITTGLAVAKAATDSAERMAGVGLVARSR